jgi:hypothetical protein
VPLLEPLLRGVGCNWLRDVGACLAGRACLLLRCCDECAGASAAPCRGVRGVDVVAPGCGTWGGAFDWDCCGARAGGCFEGAVCRDGSADMRFAGSIGVRDEGGGWRGGCSGGCFGGSCRARARTKRLAGCALRMSAIRAAGRVAAGVSAASNWLPAHNVAPSSPRRAFFSACLATGCTCH